MSKRPYEIGVEGSFDGIVVNETVANESKSGMRS
jgi:hypothetical protein